MIIPKRENISSIAIWEDTIGYSRAVKIGNVIEIFGTTSVNGKEVIGIGDPYRQTIEIINKFKTILNNAGSSLNDVVRVRIFVVNMKIGNKSTKHSRKISTLLNLLQHLFE